jgi:hypothetical protein
VTAQAQGVMPSRRHSEALGSSRQVSWAAAQRLSSAGRRRWDVIHKIAELLVHHMYPTLTQQKPFDEAAYRAGLDAFR